MYVKPVGLADTIGNNINIAMIVGSLTAAMPNLSMITVGPVGLESLTAVLPLFDTLSA
jgi:hypothetical protein